LDQVQVRLLFSAEWRLKARQLLAIAETMKDTGARLGMLNAAATYDRLADDAEAGARPPADRAG
jgi:hypothetical protein